MSEPPARLLDERPRGVGLQHAGCVARRYPAPATQFLLLPPVRLDLDLHQVDGNSQEDSPLLVLITAEGIAKDPASQARFFPGFLQGRLLRRIAPLDCALWNAPTLRRGGGDKAQRNRITASAKRNRGRLLWSARDGLPPPVSAQRPPAPSCPSRRTATRCRRAVRPRTDCRPNRRRRAAARGVRRRSRAR